MEHKRRRTLRRPPSRRPRSPYRVRLGKVSPVDKFVLYLFDENDPAKPLVTFVFNGNDVAQKQSIHFKTREVAGRWEISFSAGVNPSCVIV